MDSFPASAGNAGFGATVSNIAPSLRGKSGYWRNLEAGESVYIPSDDLKLLQNVDFISGQ